MQAAPGTSGAQFSSPPPPLQLIEKRVSRKGRNFGPKFQPANQLGRSFENPSRITRGTLTKNPRWRRVAIWRSGSYLRSQDNLGGEIMKPRILLFAAAIAFITLLAIPAQLAAQSKQGHKNASHHHYQLIDLGTFGGPLSGVQFFARG